MTHGVEKNAFRIAHMLGAIGDIKTIAGKGGFERLLNDHLLVLAFERAFEILSEASRGIADELKATEPLTPWRQIADIGNVLRHGYDGVETALLYQTAVNDIPALEQALRRMLKQTANQSIT